LSTKGDQVAIKPVRPQDNAPQPQQMRDCRGAEHSPAHQRQPVSARFYRDHCIAFDQICDPGLRRHAVGEVDNSGTPEADIIQHPDFQLRQPRERRHMLEMPKRDQGEKPVLGLPVKHHRPSPRLDRLSRL
jgi:hypothetical protein